MTDDLLKILSDLERELESKEKKSLAYLESTKGKTPTEDNHFVMGQISAYSEIKEMVQEEIKKYQGAQ